MADKNRGTTEGAGLPGAAEASGAKGARRSAAKAGSAGNGKAAKPAPAKAAPTGAAAAKSVATKGAATKAAGAKTAAAKTAGGRSAAKRAGGSGPDLRGDLRDFAAARPQGWSHDDWLAFLQHLESRGHNITEREEIGRALERERLDLALESVGGLPSGGRKALVERFGTVWGLRDADPDEIATRAGIDRGLAERIRDTCVAHG